MFVTCAIKASGSDLQLFLQVLPIVVSHRKRKVAELTNVSAELQYILTLGSIPNGADPMVECCCCFLCTGLAYILDLASQSDGNGNPN